MSFLNLPAGRKCWLAYSPELEGTDEVRFRLVYEGRLDGNGSAKHKHEIRKQLHPQLKRLWEIEPNLKGWRDPFLPQTPAGETAVDQRARQFQRNGYRFVPLATENVSLLASIEILFMRPEAPGSIIRSADMDNRLKTLFDALRMPTGESELGGYLTPAPDEDPFFVLLGDDKLLANISVESDILLKPNPDANGQFLTNSALLVITVGLRPYRVHVDNINFGS